MAVFHQAPLRYRGLLDGSTSATVFPSVTGTRWVLTGGAVCFGQASGVSQFSLIETYDSASDAFFQWNASITSDSFRFNLGPMGVQGTITNTQPSGLKFAVDVGATGTGSYSVVFTGYRTGGGY